MAMSEEYEQFDEFDDDDDFEVDYARNPKLSRRLKELHYRLEDAERRAQQADAIAKRTQDRFNEARDRIDELETALNAALTEIDELREANAMVAHVNDNRALSVDDRAVVCLQTLANDAGTEGRAAMTISEGWSTLGREFDRTRMYDVFKRAESLVGDSDICWYQTEPRGHTPPSRLILDLSVSTLPDEIAGHAIRGGRQ
jgi:uncharacterized protein YhaN